MGVYYFYVNDTKQQYFCIDPTHRHIKNYALGRNIGSRALSYLILENDPYFTGVEPHPLVGSWIGDRFFVAGDDYYPRFEDITRTYTDIGQAVIELLVELSPSDLLEYGGFDWLIEFFQSDGDPIRITPQMRKRLSHELRATYYQFPNPDLARVIEAYKEYTARLQSGPSEPDPDP